MGREAYLHRMVLGRSAYELPIPRDDERTVLVSQASLNERNPETGEAFTTDEYVQQYNIRGHPENKESRQLARQSRRAQNDVLSTIGVCVSVDEHGRVVNLQGDRASIAVEKYQRLSNMEENLTGLRLGMMEDLLSAICTVWCSNLRRRIMTFDYYIGVPMAAIVRSEVKHFGLTKFLFAGVLPSPVLHLGVFAFENSLAVVRNQLPGLLLNDDDSSVRRQVKLALLTAIETSVTCGLFSLIMAPIQCLITLQRLDLVSPWIPVPKLTGMSFFSLLIPSTPSVWTLKSLLEYSKSLAKSPLVTLGMSTLISAWIDPKITAYVNTIVPRPDNPDPVSYKTDPIEDEYLPVQTLPVLQRTLSDQLTSDYEEVVTSVASMKDTVHSSFWKLVYNVNKLLTRKLRPGLLSDTHNRGPSVDTDSATITGHGLNGNDFTHNNESEIVRSTTPVFTPPSSVPPENERPQSPRSRRRSSLPMSTYSSGSSTSSDIEPSNVQVHARQGSTSTLHMDLEVNTLPTLGGPQYTSHFSAPPDHHGSSIETSTKFPQPRSFHRVTALTLHSSQSFSFLISNLINAAIRLPLASIYQSSLARAYLSALGNTDRAWLEDHIYHSCGPAPSLYGWRAVGLYSSQLIFCFGIEFITGFTTWCLGGKIAFWIGQRWYSWGRL